MKKSLFTITILFIFYQAIAVSNEAYDKIMKAKIEILSNTQTIEGYQQLANEFERISQKEAAEWLPLYYTAFCYVNMGFRSTLTLETKDTYFNKAEALLQKAEKLSANNSEITALMGYAVMGKLSADSANRGQTMSPLAMQLFGRAIQQNPENPRALFLMAQMEYGMAQFFGNTPEKACAMAKQSHLLFEQTTEAGIQPSWGANAAKEMATSCQKP
jgi:tetratricopeptide (TPR) repeat protein